MSDDYERVKKWCKDPRGFDAAPYNSICRVFEDYDRLRAELAALREHNDLLEHKLSAQRALTKDMSDMSIRLENKLAALAKGEKP